MDFGVGSPVNCGYACVCVHMRMCADDICKMEAAQYAKS